MEKWLETNFQGILRADVSYFLCFAREAKEIADDVCTQAKTWEEREKLVQNKEMVYSMSCPSSLQQSDKATFRPATSRVARN